ncbi:MAG: hypothetical protein P4L36_19630 [Holophaga sp.]|nr:hypothetical protein [Holophaga sp.]
MKPRITALTILGLGLALASGTPLRAASAPGSPLTDRSHQLTFQVSLLATDIGGTTTSYPIPNVTSLVLRRQVAAADADCDDGPAPNTLTLETLDGELQADGSSLVAALRKLILDNGTVTAQVIFQFPAAAGVPNGSLVQLGGVRAIRSSPVGPANQDWTSLKAFALTRIELSFSTCQVTPEYWTTATDGGNDGGNDGGSAAATPTANP